MACQGVVRNAINKPLILTPGFVILPGNYAVAVSVLHCVSNEDWWRRRESNPRPEAFGLAALHAYSVLFVSPRDPTDRAAGG